MQNRVFKDGTIYYQRGDTDVLALALTKNGVAYTLASGDTALLSIKKDVKQLDTYDVQKAVSSDGTITMLAADTKRLDAGLTVNDPRALYYYDVQISFADGQVKTIGPYRFYLLAEVTVDAADLTYTEMEVKAWLKAQDTAKLKAVINDVLTVRKDVVL